MFELAQDILKLVQKRFRTMLHSLVEFVEAMGVPQMLSALLQRLENSSAMHPYPEGPPSTPPPSSPVGNAPQVPDRGDGKTLEGGEEAVAKVSSTSISEMPKSNRKRPSAKRRALSGSSELTEKIRSLKIEDAIDGSTYLARIIWSLGVAELEGLGPLRPADIARLIMSRSPVSLEPPNVARYIRRNKPTSIRINHTEGSSNFYMLNEEGHSLFNEKFRPKKAN